MDSGISVFYELIEWWVAELTGTGAEAFLGTQGYAWDTPSDMAFALLGASIALLTLSRLHDQQIENQSWRDDDNDGLPMDRRTFS